MAFSVRSDVGVVADHRSTVVTAGDLDQCSGRNDMTELRLVRAVHRAGAVRIVVNNRDTLSGLIRSQ